MSDYTPTTEEVRELWGVHVGDIKYFDVWLASVKAEAWEQGFENAHAAHHRENVRLNRRSPAIVIINPYRKETT